MPNTVDLSSTPLFADNNERARLPTPIAQAVDLMIFEIAESGEETTADETAAAIEATFAHLGRLWVAEYLHAADTDADMVDEALNRILLERAASGRPTLTGQWVGLARRIRDHFVSRGTSTLLADLQAVDFGTFGDDEHPVARLLHFRNHFSHGSFQSTVAGIREHRQLLHDLLRALPCLREQPACVRDTETGVVRRADQHWTVVDAPDGIELPDAHPIITGADHASLDLYPLLHLSYDGGSPTLTAPNKTHPARKMFERAAFSIWLERYERDRNGFLAYDGPNAPDCLPAGAIEGKSGIRAALGAEKPGLVLVEGFPGCGAEGAIAALQADDPLSLGLERYAAIDRICVREGDLGQSGLTVARLVLRLIERALGEEAGHRASSMTDILADDGPLQAACDALSESEKQVVLGIEGLHLGTNAYRGESITVREVYEALAGTPVDVVATTVPGGLERPLFDRKVQVPVTEAPDTGQVGHWVARLCHNQPLRGRVLRALVEADEPLHLFTLCDAIEKGAEGAVFEPAVERALWDLRPLLSWNRAEVELEEGVCERVRLWAPFSPTITPEMTGGAA